jgi:hypothetical protein
LRSAPVVFPPCYKTWLKVGLKETGLDSPGFFSLFLSVARVEGRAA